MTVMAIFGMPGWQEALIVAVVGLLLFRRRIPRAARSLGRSIVEFRRGLRDDRLPASKA